MLWDQQATPKDSFVVACFGADQSNCPQDRGPDHDFGQSPILVSLRDGRRVLVIGQKSGVVHALDPDREGKILWQARIGKGGPLGGTEWGSAADQDRIYVANSDVRFLRDGTRRLNSSEGGGLFGLDLATGKIAMQVAPVASGENGIRTHDTEPSSITDQQRGASDRIGFTNIRSCAAKATERRRNPKKIGPG